MNKSKAMNLIREYIDNHDYLRDNVIAIYGMGSFAKSDIYNDIDLNFFVKKNEYKMLSALDDFIKHFEQVYDISIDINLIDYSMTGNNFIKTNLFIHRNRHSLFLYELKCLNCLIYGLDILKNIEFTRDELIPESLKIALTIRHRISKKYLTMFNRKEHASFMRKNVRYVVEFFLIFNGIKDPYFYTCDQFLKEYPIFGDYKEVLQFAFSKSNEIDMKMYGRCYDLVVYLSDEMKNKFLLLLNDFKKSKDISQYSVSFIEGSKIYGQYKLCTNA